MGKAIITKSGKIVTVDQEGADYVADKVASCCKEGEPFGLTDGMAVILCEPKDARITRYDNELKMSIQQYTPEMFNMALVQLVRVFDQFLGPLFMYEFVLKVNTIHHERELAKQLFNETLPDAAGQA